MHHTSGLRDYLTLADLAGYRPLEYYDAPELKALLARQRDLNFHPGSGAKRVFSLALGFRLHLKPPHPSAAISRKATSFYAPTVDASPGSRSMPRARS